MPITSASARSALVIPWLYLCLFMVLAMVFVGGVTRLTESGLSIVEWKLVSGILPPLSDEAWEAELQAYRATPEYIHKNTGMSVDEFKRIFWLEWLHRLLGRTTGLVFALPFFYFALRRQLDRPLALRCFTAMLLVGAQGAVGWMMVKSGLVDDPRVSPIKLSMHLSLAFIVFCHVLWTLWLLKPKSPLEPAEKNHRRWSSRLLFLLIFLQIILGAWVAGMDAGLTYNTWPLMDGDIAPPGLMSLEPWHRNLIENIPQVQFQHRMMAYAVALGVFIYTLRYRRWWLGAVLKLQFTLGVLTLVHVVPIGLASAHQIGALALLCLCLREMFLTRSTLATAAHAKSETAQA